MKPERYRTTLCGERAARRVKWTHPKEVWMHEGKPYVNAFVVSYMDEDCKVHLLAVSSQLGIDQRGRHVLPNNIVAPVPDWVSDPRTHIMVHFCGLPVGDLQAHGQQVVDAVNASLGSSSIESPWYAPIGKGPVLANDGVSIKHINTLQEGQ